MNEEQTKQAFRKLGYFFENNINIHFSLTSGGWKNGKIKNLDEDKMLMVLDENEEGELPILIENIVFDSIKKFKELGE